MTQQTPSTPDAVRLALPGEAAAVAAIQRRWWEQVLPADLGSQTLAAISADEMAEAWRLAITRPPQARCRVLVATAEQRVVGFATTIPAPDADAHPREDGAVEEFAVDPVAQRRGHGSRLLNACVDTLRADGFRRATWWVAATDDVLRGFLTGAGWAPDGAWREIGVEDHRLKQVRLHTAIDDPLSG